MAEMQHEMMRFDFTIEDQEHRHLHDDIELIYVLQGTLEVVVDEEQYKLEKDDFLMVNRNMMHRYKGSDEVLVGSFYVAYPLLTQLMTQTNITFWCNSTVDKSSAYDDVRVVVKELAKDFFQNRGIGRIHLIAQYYELLHMLTKHFLVTAQDTNSEEEVDADQGRIAHIKDYVASNYRNKISLSELASQLFLSEAYLSKYIKSKFGMNFLEYVNRVRLNHAVTDLLYGDQSVTRIALENGFANVGTFNRVFKERYELTPKTYRKKMHSQQKEGNESTVSESLKKRMDAYIALNPTELDEKSGEANDFMVDCTVEGEPLDKNWGKMINVGTASDLLRSNLQDSVKEVAGRLRFRYIRIWDLYSEEMYIDINAKNRFYNFDKLDRVFDFVVGMGIYPYLELNVKPKLVLKSVSKTLIERENSLSFDSLENAKHFFESLMVHLINRYGIAQIKEWYFELWKEESESTIREKFTYEADTMQYIKLFNTVAEVIYRYIPEAKLGGAGLSIRYGKETISEILRLWHDQPYQPRFLSFYSYPYVLGEFEDIKVNKISTDKNYLSNYVERALEITNQTDYGQVPLHISEWNSTISNRNALNDSCYKGAFMMKNLIDSIGKVDLIGYWFLSDVFADYYDSNYILNGSSGLVSKDGIPKPAYYAIEFMNRLGKRILSQGDYYVVTDAGYDEIRVACHNYKFLNHRYFMMSEDEVTIQDLNHLYEDLEQRTINFKFKVPKEGQYVIKTYAINREHGSVQDEWLRMACPVNLIKEEVGYLKRVCVPRLSINYVETKGGELNFSTQLAPNEIQYMEIKSNYK